MTLVLDLMGKVDYLNMDSCLGIWVPQQSNVPKFFPHISVEIEMDFLKSVPFAIGDKKMQRKNTTPRPNMHASLRKALCLSHHSLQNGTTT